MSFLLVLMLAVSTRCIPGLWAICLTSTGGGVTAIGAMALEVSITRSGEKEVVERKVCSWRREGQRMRTQKHRNTSPDPTLYINSNATGVRLHT
jgi:hypothetical protein